MFGTLNLSLTGLNAAKTAVDNVSNNIANENTAGYKKRVVQLSELEQTKDTFTGRGVNATSAYRITSQYMYDKLISENTKANYYTKSAAMVGNVESIFKETDDSGFSSDINRYYQSVENLRANPTSLVYKSALQEQGTILVNSLQNLYTSVENHQENEKTELYSNVEHINDTLKQIGILNQKMQQYGESNDLLDKRDQLELELSNYADINVNRDNQFYELKIGGEVAISDNTVVRTLNVVEENKLQKDEFNYTKFNTVTNTTDVYDALKYNSDFTAKTFDANDVVTYKLNNEFEVSVTFGESLTGDWDNDINTANTTQVVSSSNLTRAMVLKINANADMKDLVTAYNGDYSVDANGNKIIDNSKDNFLRIESKFEGTAYKFDGRIAIQKYDSSATPVLESRESIYKNDSESNKAQSNVYISIYDKEVPIKSGILKAQIENLSSESPTNKFQVYLDKLDAFVQTLSDISDKYIKKSSGEYVYGEAASDESLGSINSIGLFSGSNVKTLKFNKNLVNDLTQNKLDYLASIQWKTDLAFEGKSQFIASSEKSSLLEFYRELKVDISSDKENIDFSQQTQSSVKASIQTSYDQLTKVDKDEELLDLMKFQAAYNANAKIITAIDEMIQTLLGLKR